MLLLEFFDDEANILIANILITKKLRQYSFNSQTDCCRDPKESFVDKASLKNISVQLVTIKFSVQVLEVRSCIYAR